MNDSDRSADPTRASAGAFSRAQDVLQFWREAGPDKWFAKSQAFDDAFGNRFMSLHLAAARRELEAWVDDPQACLALLILLDQFPRNVFRGTAHMFATDPLARHYARALLDRGHEAHIAPELRVFVCTPFIHSELPADQDEALALYRKLAPDALPWAMHHHDIITRFGRFPHRNACLARPSTAGEQHFLDEGGFSG